jgi:predicted esterase
MTGRGIFFEKGEKIMGKGLLRGILAAAFLIFFAWSAADAESPQVIATNPPNGAVGVRPDVDTIQVLLDRPISWSGASLESKCLSVSDNWPTAVVPVIGSDGLLYHFERTNRGVDLPLGSQVRLTINPPGAGSDCFRDSEGTLLPTYDLAFTVRQNPDDPPVEPRVVSTDPPKGATGLSPDLSSVSITFSGPMKETDARLGAWFLSIGWGPPSDYHWSADRRTLTITRGNVGTPIPSGQTIIFILNWDLSLRLQDTAGNVLQEYTYSFTIEGNLKDTFEKLCNVSILKIPEDPARGFYWPYYLSIPNDLQDPATLFVEPNNTGVPALDYIVHDVKAAETLYSWAARVNLNWNIKAPILVPTFPRSYGVYTQALSLWLPADCGCPDLERPDLQMAAMIEDAKGRLRSMGYIMDDRVFMNGFSASCGFTGGFTLLHPELIKAAACGGGLPAEYDPQRISVLENLTGEPIDLQAYFQVPFYLYIGDQDGNYDADLWLRTEQFYESSGANAQLVLYPGVGHTITPAMYDDLENFFRRYDTLFADMPGIDYWPYPYAVALYHAGITAGCSTNPLKYCPEDAVTREQMAVFLIRALNEVPSDGYCGTANPFPDVGFDRWSCKSIKKLSELGITTGYADGRFGPDHTVTREQMAVFLTRALNEVPQDGYCGTTSPFADVPFDKWSCKYIKRLAELGITTGIGDGRVGPGDSVTRAQMAAFLSRAFQLVQ